MIAKLKAKDKENTEELQKMKQSYEHQINEQTTGFLFEKLRNNS